MEKVCDAFALGYTVSSTLSAGRSGEVREPGDNRRVLVRAESKEDLKYGVHFRASSDIRLKCHSSDNKASGLRRKGLPQAERAAQPCIAPELDFGYFIPEQVTYPSQFVLTYGCENGYKPAEEAWWATTTCQNGEWFPAPKCIDEKACIPPTIPNGRPINNPRGWFEDGSTMTTKCDSGYVHKDRIERAMCNNGNWTSLPICQERILPCSEPPNLSHAVIVQEPKEVYDHLTDVMYQCVDGYAINTWSNKQNIFCRAGRWDELQPCHVSCSVDTAEYPDLVPAGVQFLKNNEGVFLLCKKKRFYWIAVHHSFVQCKNGKATLSKCCSVTERDIYCGDMTK
ncbi:complement factor H-related protein 2-like [Echeneis naucrates]|uniref:complement factor H-related protein 2-like n=1 Tax=Echeneis naucrates TaxID=173247 RepID=UPI0011139FBD|nr:complement factor H-related protein 2-like [Echeneis naucrates]